MPEGRETIFGASGGVGREAEGGDELAQAGAVELDKFWRSGAAAPALEQDEGGNELGGRRASGEIEVHLERDGVARCRGGEVGREVEAKHGCAA